MIQSQSLKRLSIALGFDTQPAIDRAKATLGALMADKPSISPHIYNSALSMMTGALLNAKPELAPYITQLTDEARELAYIEQMRQVYGNEMVDAALTDARQSYRTFYHALQARVMQAQLATSFTAMREAFGALGTAVSAALSKTINEQRAQGNDTQGNREERRSAKYGTRRKQESDQLWARRNNRKRRH